MILLPSLPTISNSSLFPSAATSDISFGQPIPQQGHTNSWDSTSSTRPASGSLSSIYGGPVPSRLSVSSLQLAMEPFSTFSSSSSFTPNRSSECLDQEQLSQLTTAAQSWTYSLPTYDSATHPRQPNATALQPSPDIFANSVQGQTSSLAYSPPSFHMSLSLPSQPSERTSNSAPTLPPKPQRPSQPIPRTLSTLPEQISQNPSSPHFGATFSPGSVDAYELWAEPAVSQLKHDVITEMMGDIQVRPLAEIPSRILPWESQSNDSFKELPRNIPTQSSKLHLSSEMQADSVSQSSSLNCDPKVPGKGQDQTSHPVTCINCAPLESDVMPPQTFNVSQIPHALHPSTSSQLISNTTKRPKALSFSMDTSL
jgi:hypothetical protein